MNTLLAVLRGPLDAGVLYPHIWLAAALLLLKLFDVWSTHYIVGKKGGRERAWTLTYQLIAKTGSVKKGLAIDFALVAATAWFCYPYWPLIGGVVAWYAYWMAIQVGELWKIYHRQQQS